MKTKDEVKKVEESGSQGVERPNRLKVSAAVQETPVGFSTPQLLDSWTAELREQSEYIYENKGSGEDCQGAGGGCGSGASAPVNHP
jgi:hypothetical protein